MKVITCDRCDCDICDDDYQEMEYEHTWCLSCAEELDAWRTLFVSFGCQQLKDAHDCDCRTATCPSCKEEVPTCLMIEKIGGSLCPVCAHSKELAIGGIPCADSEECGLCLMQIWKSDIDGYFVNCFGEPHTFKTKAATS